jgi:hypothetical protein
VPYDAGNFCLRPTGIYHIRRLGSLLYAYAQRPPFSTYYLHPLSPILMTVRGMRWGSHLAISLLLFAGSSFSQSNPPNCTTGWDWVSNSFFFFCKICSVLDVPISDQTSPVYYQPTKSHTTAYIKTLALFLHTSRVSALAGVSLSDLSTFFCYPFRSCTYPNTVFEIDPLPQGRHYTGPDSGQGTPCQCNTVVYSLVSACAGCQGGQWIPYVFRLKRMRYLHR